MKKILFLSMLLVASLTTIKAQIEGGGVYVVQSKFGTVMDVVNGSKDAGASIQLWERNDTPAQQFRIIEASKGSYHLINVRSGKALDIAGGNDSAGTNLQQWDPNYTSSQKFKIEDAGKGYVYIKTSQDNYLTPETIHGKKGTNVFLWNNNQVAKFKLIKL